MQALKYPSAAAVTPYICKVSRHLIENKNDLFKLIKPKWPPQPSFQSHMKTDNTKKPIYTKFQWNCEKKSHFDYRWKSEFLIRSSPYSWVTSHKKLERSNNYFLSNRVKKEFLNKKIKMAAISSFSVAHENGQLPIDSQTLKTYIYQVSKKF